MILRFATSMMETSFDILLLNLLHANRVSVACKPSLWPRPSPRTGKRISDARDERHARDGRPQTASGRSSFAAETACPVSEPAKMPANCGLFLRDRETAFRIGLRGDELHARHAVHSNRSLCRSD